VFEEVRRELWLVTVAILAVIVQVDVLPQFRVFGLVPDVVAISVVAVALLLGARIGAVYGFAVGLLLDMFLRPPAGLSACAYLLVGHAVGTGRTMLVRRTWWQNGLIVAAGSIASGAIYVVLSVLFGQEFLWSWRTFRVLTARAVVDGVLGLAVVPLVSRPLRAHADVAGSFR
jgi:rod shape-determining protein MreD